MAKFIILYSGGKAPTTKSVVEAGAPFARSKTVTSSGVQDGTGGNVSNGYSVVDAADVGAAAKLVKSCPIIAEAGKVHVFELAAM